MGDTLDNGGQTWTSGPNPPANWNGDIASGVDTSHAGENWLGDFGAWIGGALSSLDPNVNQQMSAGANAVGDIVSGVAGGASTALSVVDGTASGWTESKAALLVLSVIAILFLIAYIAHEVA